MEENADKLNDPVTESFDSDGLLPGEADFISWITEQKEKKVDSQGRTIVYLMDTEEASEYLGITIGHLYRIVREGKISFGHIGNGRRLYFEQRFLDEYDDYRNRRKIDDSDQ